MIRSIGHEQHSTSLEGRRVSPQLAHLEGKSFLVVSVVSEHVVSLRSNCWSLKLEV